MGISRGRMAAILELVFKMTAKLLNKHPIVFVVFVLVEKDTSLFELILCWSYVVLCFSKWRMAAILNFVDLLFFPVVFERYIGAIFFLNIFYLSNPSRYKGTERMVTDLAKMTILLLLPI